MTNTPGSTLADDMATKLEEMGISNFVIAFADPDAGVDVVRILGSKYWRAGLGMDLMDDVRHDRNSDRKGPEEESPEG